jgi:hypothetical protein
MLMELRMLVLLLVRLELFGARWIRVKRSGFWSLGGGEAFWYGVLSGMYILRDILGISGQILI